MIRKAAAAKRMFQKWKTAHKYAAVTKKQKTVLATWARLKLLAADRSPRVRYQVCFAVGQINRPDRVQLIAGLFSRSPENPWLQAAVPNPTLIYCLGAALTVWLFAGIWERTWPGLVALARRRTLPGKSSTSGFALLRG